MANRKIKYNPTARAIRRGLMQYKKRIDIPLWHPEHLTHAINGLRACADEMERLQKSNSLRGVDKMIYAQGSVHATNLSLNQTYPKDPRTRGVHTFDAYDNGRLVETAGVPAVNAREDLE
tara:strand:- start:256 stop:615 length:360 start_codon:yes stop_codon:yes gene_type:complete